MASNDAAADVKEPSPTTSTIRFEGGSPLPAVQTADPMPAPPSAAAEPPKSSAKAKKGKTAKRRPANNEDVTTTISRGFDTLQRSISSMF
ncbi:MAG: hypothetical protein QM780_17100 [Hyphomicrobium sp.]|uniref:hypothetical protein n=1 Tax=Hyphomicrobium sp. TaxID=82 RepID=UPI0039E316F0